MLILSEADRVMPLFDRVAKAVGNWFKHLALIGPLAAIAVVAGGGEMLRQLGPGASILTLIVTYLLGIVAAGTIVGILAPMIQSRATAIGILCLAFFPFAFVTLRLLMQLSISDWLLWAGTGLGALNLGIIYGIVEWRHRY